MTVIKVLITLIKVVMKPIKVLITVIKGNMMCAKRWRLGSRVNEGGAEENVKQKNRGNPKKKEINVNNRRRSAFSPKITKIAFSQIYINGLPFC